jgi:predicted small metal-binding protein
MLQLAVDFLKIGGDMAKELRCGDLMPGCQAVVEGKDEAELMAKAAEHAKTAHGLQQIPPELANKVRAAIREKGPAQKP